MTLPPLKKAAGMFLLRGLILFFFTLWFYGGMMKLMDFDTFRDNLSRTPLAEYITLLAAWILPVLEMAIGFLALLRETRLTAFCAGLFMSALFLAYGIRMNMLDSSLPCACGGIFLHLSWAERIVANACCMVVFLAAVTLELQRRKGRFKSFPAQQFKKKGLPLKDSPVNQVL